jgi:hypothetical protein
VAETHYGALSRTGKTALNGVLQVDDATGSSSASTGALIVKGGAGVAKNLNVGGNASIAGAVDVNSAADSSSASTGALTVKGGAGVAKNLNVGGNASIAGSLAASGALSDAAASTTLPETGRADIWSRIQVLRNNAKAALHADAAIAGKKTFSTPPIGVSNLAKYNDGATAANIFANPPLGSMGAISHHHFEANPFPAANKSPLQSGSAESWEVITLNLSRHRAVQIAAQAYNVSGNQGRAFIRCRHVDNDDYSQWQAWREILKAGDKASLLAINNSADMADALQFMQLSGQNVAGDNPTGGWCNIIKMNHGNGDAYYNNTIAFPFSSNRIYTRHRAGGSAGSWSKVVLEGDSPTFGGVYAGATSYNPTGIEFLGTAGHGHGGHLDFHYSGSAADYTSRIIEEGSGVLALYASGGLAFSSTPILPRTNPVSGSVTVSGNYTPPRGLYIFAANGSAYYNYSGGPFSGAEALASANPATSNPVSTISYKRF